MSTDDTERLAAEALAHMRGRAQLYDPDRDGYPEDFERIEVGDDLEPVHPLALKHFGWVWANDVEEEVIDWIWEGRIPKGYVTLFAGKPKAGKSIVGIDAVARLTSGRRLPGNRADIVRPVPVMWVSYEETRGKIKKALVGASAEMKNVALVTERLPGSVPELIRGMDAMVEAGGFEFIVIDNLLYLLNGGDGYKPSETVPLLRELQAWAEARKVAVVLLVHSKKGSGHTAMDRIMGSTAIAAVARAAIQVTRRPDRVTRELHTVWMSMDEEPAHGYVFRIGKTEGGRPVVDWVEEVENDPDGAVHREAAAADPEQGGKGPSKTSGAEEVIREILASGPVPSDEALARVMAEAGVSKNTAKAAKKALGVRSEKDGDGWVWVPPKVRDQGDHAQKTLGPLDPWSLDGDPPHKEETQETKRPREQSATTTGPLPSDREPGDDDPDKIGW